MEVPHKLKVGLSYDPAISLLNVYPKKTKTLIQQDTYSLMFTAALFIVIIVKMWRNLTVSR